MASCLWFLTKLHAVSGLDPILHHVWTRQMWPDFQGPPYPALQESCDWRDRGETLEAIHRVPGLL